MKEYIDFSKEHCDWLIVTLPVDDAASPFVHDSNYRQIYERYPTTVLSIQERQITYSI